MSKGELLFPLAVVLAVIVIFLFFLIRGINEFKKDDPRGKTSFAFGVLGIVLSLVFGWFTVYPYLSSYSQGGAPSTPPKESAPPTPSNKPTPSDAPAKETTSTKSGLVLPTKPLSPYGIALRNNLVDGQYYSYQDKKEIVNQTYETRHDPGVTWYSRGHYYDENTGLRIALYYADGLLFFADGNRDGDKSEITFYFWGDQLLAYHDKRGTDKGLVPVDNTIADSINDEFGDIYARAMQLK